MPKMRVTIQWLCLIALAATSYIGSSNGLQAQEAPTWSEAQQLFTQKCTLCHSGKNAPLGLRLDTLKGALNGSERGPVLKAGHPDGSELIRRVRGESQPRMPLTGPPFLSVDEITMLERWVEAGLPAGDVAVTPDAPEEPRRPGPGEVATFAHIEPILLKRCVKCHKKNGLMGRPPEGLRLDSYAHVIAGGERLAVVPGNLGLSELIRRIEGKAQPRMPFDGPPWLDAEDMVLLRQWVEEGARNAKGEPMSVPAGGEVRFRGRMTDPSSINGASFVLDNNTRIDDNPSVGDEIEIKGVVKGDGTVRANRLRKR